MAKRSIKPSRQSKTHQSSEANAADICMHENSQFLQCYNVSVMTEQEKKENPVPYNPFIVCCCTD